MNQEQGDQAVQAIVDWMRHVDQDGYYGGEPGAVHAQRDARDLYRSVVAPLLAERDRQVAELKAAIADIDAHATRMGLLNNDDPDGSPHHYIVTVGALHRALGKAYTAEPCERERSRLRAELERSEASRRDWAAEAAAMDAVAERVLTFHAQNEDRLSFIARRYLSPVKHRDRFTGISSDALAWFAIGRRDEPNLGEYPADERDLAACERTYESAPEFLRERMLPVLERYRRHVAAGSISRPVCAVHPEGSDV